jgi:hypothetical protein
MSTHKEIAALFVRRDSIYKTMEGVDAWDIDRDARLWPGGCPVVAHPPCRAWGQLRHFAKPRPDEKDLARWSIAMIREWGGILEHPAGSTLWSDMALPQPGRRDSHGGFTVTLPQFWFGHLAEKATKLYVYGCSPRDLPPVPMLLGEAPRTMSGTHKHLVAAGIQRPELLKKDREKTPPAFAEWLVESARKCNPSASLDKLLSKPV